MKKSRAALRALLLLCLSASSVHSASLEEADSQFQKGLYQEALRSYERLSAEGPEEQRWKALYRACESEGLLFRYGDALERLRKAQPPQDEPWLSRFLLLKAELTREYLKQYGYAARTDAVEGDADSVRRTPKELHAAVDASYRRLWDLRHGLARRGIAQEAYFVEVEKADRKRYPTQFDFFLERWTQYLEEEAPEPKDKEKRLAALMEEGARLDGADRAEAREYWRVEAAELSSGESGAASLERLMEELKSAGPRAQAGYAAAQRHSDQERQSRALVLCEDVQKRWAGTRGARECAKLEASIKLPSLTIEGKTVPPPGLQALAATTRNLDKVHLRLYATTPEELMRFQGERNSSTWSGALNHANDDTIRAFLKRAPARQWSEPVRYEIPYVSTRTVLDLPDAPAGLYLAMASGDSAFAPGSSLLQCAVVNVTSLVLVGTSGFEPGGEELIYRPQGRENRALHAFHFYLLDGVTGRPVRNATLDLRLSAQGGNWRDRRLFTDPLGRAQADVSVNLTPAAYNHYMVDPLAGLDGQWAFWANPAYLYFNLPPYVQLFLETDRPIYRPGQKVAFRVSAVKRVPRGYAAYAGPRSVEVAVNDANGEVLYRLSRKPDAFGALKGEFTIPAGRLLGEYSISATVSEAGTSFYGSTGFAVEEYKRPEFEATLEDAAGPWQYGREAEVRGSVEYYFGAAAPKAKVKYTVTRQVHFPWFCWWWSWRFFPQAPEEVASGETEADEQGVFRFSFTPQPKDAKEKDPLPARFRVAVAAREAGGRTVKAEKEFTAGKNAFLFQITPSAGFALAGKPLTVETRLLTLSETPVAGAASYALHRLEEEPEQTAPERDWNGGFAASPSLEKLYRDVPDGPKAQEGTLAYGKDGKASFSLKGLPPGAYRLSLRAMDAWGGEVKQSIILLSADPEAKAAPFKLVSLCVPERGESLVGETARFLLGSAEIDGLLHYEVWGGQELLERGALQGGGIRIVSVPLTERHKGGITVRWFGIKDFRPRSGAATVKVPWKEKELKVRLQHQKTIAPGQNVSWSLTASDREGKPVDAVASVRMYDRSLEYYARAEGADVGAVYAARGEPNPAQGSQHARYGNGPSVEKGWIKRMLDLYRSAIEAPRPPGFRVNRSRAYGRWGPLSKRKGLEMEYDAESAPVPASAPAERMEMATLGLGASADKAQNKAAGKEAQAPPAAAVKARKDFSETAYFNPVLRLASGAAAVAFRAPEQLTSWRISGGVLTKDVKVGRFSEETATRKDLMVRVEMPRFFREGDEGSIKAVVHNETDGELSGELTLSVSEDGAGAAARLGLGELSRPFKIKAHGVSAQSWSLKAPSGTTSFTVRAVARAGALADAEERELPILPSRQRLIESLVVALNGDDRKTLKLAALAGKDLSRVDELAQLQIEPQLALTLLNSLPFLVHYPYECVEQTLNRYVPAAVVLSVYKNHPRIAQAASKLPKRSTITPAWEKDDPKRLIQLMETPWLRESRGRDSDWPVIDLFDEKVVARNKQDSLAKLLAAQNPDGGLPWFAGGHSDPYITLVVLAGMAEAQHYGVEAPPAFVEGALRYVMGEIPKRLKPAEENLSLILYAAYVVTSFPEALSAQVPSVLKAPSFAKAWVDYADKHSGAMTQLGKAYAAFAYRRLGDTAKSEAYLDRAMDGLREDKAAGAYWQPEKQAWLWYNDGVEKHAFLLRTLQTLRPEDPRIPGLVQWLVFSRKGGEWKSTKASAAAIFTLLDFMKSRGALDKGDSFTVDWGPVHETAAVGPEEWLSRPLRWTKEGAEITPELAEPKLSKSGPGLAFASVTHVYSTEKLAEESAPGLLAVRRLFYRRVKEGEDYRLKPLSSGDAVKVGEEIEVRLQIAAKSQFEYMHLKDPRGAGFEAEELRSGWKWDQLGRYEEPRDSLSNFFVAWLPHGEYVLRYRVRPTTPGRYRIGAATLQSMYSPEFAAHSAGFELAVEE